MDKICRHYQQVGPKGVCKHPCAPDRKPCILDIGNYCLLFEARGKKSLKILIN